MQVPLKSTPKPTTRMRNLRGPLKAFAELTLRYDREVFS
jgi:hypothetical protein